MRTAFENSLADVVEKSQERPAHHIPHPPPSSIPEPSRSSHHRHLSSPPFPQPSHHSRRSRSIRRRSVSPEIDKRPVSIHRSPPRRRISSRHRRQSSRDFSPPRDRDRSRDRRDRGRSITLKSASLLRREQHYEQDQDRSVYSQDMSSRPPAPREPPRWQQPTTKEDYYNRGHRQQDPSQWQDWDDWGKWKPPTSHDKSSWSPRQPDHAHPTFHQHSAWDITHFHSHHPAARLSAAPHSRPLTAFSSSAQSHRWSKKRHPRSDTGDHSQGSSSLPAGHMQISLHDSNKAEWIKWVKFGLAHPERMKAASELPEEERPKPIPALTSSASKTQ